MCIRDRPRLTLAQALVPILEERAEKILDHPPLPGLHLDGHRHSRRQEMCIRDSGIARVSGRPAALLCTSGSAPANWFPAVIEADLAAVPLLLLSAARPPELTGWGANQTVDQHDLFGQHVRAMYSPALPTADFVPAYLHRLAARVLADSVWPLPGPVHVNLAFREPLLPDGEFPETGRSGCRPAIRLAQPRLLPDARLIAASAAEISGRPGVIVCGGADYPEGFGEGVAALAGALDCPILAEPLSNLRFGGHDRSHLCVYYDCLLYTSRCV